MPALAQKSYAFFNWSLGIASHLVRRLTYVKKTWELSILLVVYELSERYASRVFLQLWNEGADDQISSSLMEAQLV